jgi:pyrroloquinoline quinone (PQQ) biosynthesis protein C
MTPYDQLVTETAAARCEFLAIPLLTRALNGMVPRSLYIEFLTQAFHHVRHTCFLLSLAATKTRDRNYGAALRSYMVEEDGHEQWILNDIAAMGGDAQAAASCRARPPCRAMVGYAHFAIEWISPYSMLGMVHVLEGTSVALAGKAADALERSFGSKHGEGFTYLKTHGALDQEHVGFFRDTMNGIHDTAALPVIIDAANMMYWLYGNIFRDLQRQLADEAVAAEG